MPSSSLVEVEVEVGGGVEMGFEVEVKVRSQNFFFGVDGWMRGWKNGE